jgi:hypothetical protein
MSAYAPGAAGQQTSIEVAFAPNADVSRCNKLPEQKASAYFNHLVGGGAQRRWDGQS